MKQSKQKKLAIIGSGDFKDYELMVKEVSKIENVVAIVSGGAEGADTLGQRYAKDNGLPILIYYPDWNELGQSAVFLKNEQVVDKADELIAFVKNGSRESTHPVKLAKEKGIPVKVIDV